MIISNAWAADVATGAPAAADTFWMNMGLIGLMFVLFYLLLIRPQQKRLREQREMLDTLKKGDAIVTAGGLIGTVSRVVSDKEVEVDLGNGLRVMAMRYTIQMKVDDASAPAKTSKDILAPAKAEKPSDTVAKAEEKSAKKTTAKAAGAKTPGKRGRPPKAATAAGASAAAKPAAKSTSKGKKKPGRPRKADSAKANG